MEKNDVIAAIQALEADPKNRSATARLREVFDEVERALTLGVKRSALMSALNKQGFNFTPHSLATAITRIRQSRAELSDHDIQAQLVKSPARDAKVTARSMAGGKITNPTELARARQEPVDLNKYRE